MALIGGELGFRLLKGFVPSSGGPVRTRPDPEASWAEILRHFGPDFGARVAGRIVVDFGCGDGHYAVAMACKGAKRVIGIDIQAQRLQMGRRLAKEAGVEDRCVFVSRTDERADLVISKDAFEHFHDVALTLETMAGLLQPEGSVLAAFGPTWLHPYGGHLFSVFPWARLLFTEKALIRWRVQYRNDGVKKFSEVEGGVNQLTIAEFERLVSGSPLRIACLDVIPIRGISILRSRPLREIGASIVRCSLVTR